MENYHKIEQLSQKATHKYLETRNKLMLEAVIGCFLDTHSPVETAEILREFAKQLEEFG